MQPRFTFRPAASCAKLSGGSELRLRVGASKRLVRDEEQAGSGQCRRCEKAGFEAAQAGIPYSTAGTGLMKANRSQRANHLR